MLVLLLSMKKIWIFSPNQESRTQERKSIFESQLKSLGIEIDAQAKIDTDLALCIGGDGSLLSMIRNLGSLRTSIPVMGIHSSPGLGFLHSLSMPQDNDEIKKLAEKFSIAFKNNEFLIQNRWGLACSLLGPESNIADKKEFWAMNDCVLSKGSLSRMVRLKVSADGTILYPLLRGDGLVVSTATGSTAYSFSAGGPVISPELECMMMTPICPHEISNRPILLGPQSILEIEILESKSPCFLTEDGQTGMELKCGQLLRIRKSLEPVRWCIPQSQNLITKNYFELLRDKLGFGAIN